MESTQLTTQSTAPAADDITSDLPGLVKTRRNFFENVGAISLKNKYHFPTKELHSIYLRCARLFHSTQGGIIAQRFAALSHFDTYKETICLKLAIDDSDWLKLRKFLRDELPRLFAIRRDDIQVGNSCGCLDFLCNEGTILVRNPTALDTVLDTGARDISNDRLIPYQEMFPDIFDYHVKNLPVVTLEDYKKSVLNSGVTLNKLIRRHSGDFGLLSEIRKAIAANNIYITGTILQCMIDNDSVSSARSQASSVNSASTESTGATDGAFPTVLEHGRQECGAVRRGGAGHAAGDDTTGSDRSSSAGRNALGPIAETVDDDSVDDSIVAGGSLSRAGDTVGDNSVDDRIVTGGSFSRSGTVVTAVGQSDE